MFIVVSIVLLLLHRLLNANKIVCVRGDTFRGLEKLSLLSLYDNQLKTLANDTFTPLKSVQTLYVVSYCAMRLIDGMIHFSGI
jgi:hypothetical protein